MLRNPELLIYLLPAIIAALTVHEASHALAALLLGDSTARESGRVSLNPLRHIDPFGFLMLVIAGFGWAKPVVFQRHRLRNPVRDQILIAIAGPVSNFVLALIAALVLKLIFSSTPAPGERLLNFVFTFMYINLALGVFNMLPIPPLDGSHLYTAFLDPAKSRWLPYLQRYGFLVLLVLIFSPRITGVTILPIGSIIESIAGGIFSLIGL